MQFLFNPFKAVKIDIEQPYFDFVIDTESHTASLQRLTIGINERIDVIVPDHITWAGKNFTVNSIHKSAFANSIDRMTGLQIPKTIEKNENNKQACQLVVDYSNIPLLEKIDIKEYFEKE